MYTKLKGIIRLNLMPPILAESQVQGFLVNQTKCVL